MKAEKGRKITEITHPQRNRPVSPFPFLAKTRGFYSFTSEPDMDCGGATMTSEDKPKAQTTRGGAGRRNLKRLKKERPQAAVIAFCIARRPPPVTQLANSEVHRREVVCWISCRH